MFNFICGQSLQAQLFSGGAGINSFSGCTNLSSIKFLGNLPSSIDSRSFIDGSYNIYFDITKDGWSDFNNYNNYFNISA